MDIYLLSEGALSIIMQGGKVELPVIQVLDIMKVASNNSSNERYRILLSDGKYFINTAMLIVQLNIQVESGQLNLFCIIKIRKCSLMNLEAMAKPILIIHELDIVASGDKIRKKIGSPKSLFDGVFQIRHNTVSNNAEMNFPFTSNTNTFTPAALQKYHIYSISNLNPYQNKWVIKARVCSKSNIRNWTKSQKNGKLFCMHLLDATDEIHVTGFGDQVDTFYDYIEVDKVYYISKCIVKPVVSNLYCNLKHDNEMILTEDTIIELCDDNIDNIPEIQYNFIPIDKIKNMGVGNFIDIMGICKSTTSLETVQSRATGKELKRRNVLLVDQTNNGVLLTLWDRDAETFDGSSHPIISLKGVAVTEFRGAKDISMRKCSVMKVNPDTFEARRLRDWFVRYGIHNAVKMLSVRYGENIQLPWISLQEVKDLRLGDSARRVYFQIHGTILLFRSENMLYKSCSNENCYKKLIDMENGIFKCGRCCTESPDFKYRLLGNVTVGDGFSCYRLSMFSDEVEKLLGMTAEEVGQAAENDKAVLAEIANKTNFKRFIFKCRSRYEMYNGINRLDIVAVGVVPVNYKEYNSYLISNINT